MKLAHPLLDHPIELKENEIVVWVIEHPSVYRSMIESLLLQLDGGDGPFVFSHKNETLAFHHCVDMITDPFHIMLNSRKILSWLKNTAAETEAAQDATVLERLGNLNEWVGRIVCDMDFSVTYDPLINCANLLEAFHLRIDMEGMSLPEKILEYMKIMRTVEKKKLFICMNLHSCLSYEELELLYRSICYEKLQVLLIEPTQSERAHPNEHLRIFDRDMCEIE